jgi:hypothetical protein
MSHWQRLVHYRIRHPLKKSVIPYSKGLSKRTTPLNIFVLLFAAQHAMDKLNAVIDAWADTVREMILSARKVIDEILCVRSEECFEREEWVEILEGDGVGFEDAEKVKWVRRGLNEHCAGMVYQVNSFIFIFLLLLSRFRSSCRVYYCVHTRQKRMRRCNRRLLLSESWSRNGYFTRR